ncbi:hypothetical protein K488DRAFT_81995 [Vararia minispora EC-137]|uniref:Uncharacterized protein n=1 Tax=Vararia minispora EC-137 TaxID=1314806 RepID=A0ACB8QXC0_9AGAM|nr:hypothetical protein K488DRAFT_81995 [Vararia minispora EC-137]
MNSPLEPASPVSSVSSVDSVILLDDDPMLHESQTSSNPRPLAKRRMPPSSGRDAKARRRETGQTVGAPGNAKKEGKERREREEYVDAALAEALRKKIGDPFDDELLARSS